MKITLLLTPRLVVILSACGVTIILLLLMLGFELGLRQAHEDYAAQAKARGESMPAVSNNASSVTANGTKPASQPNTAAMNREAP